jgi:thioredoxin 1
MSPAIEAVAASYSDRLKVVKMEIDPNPATTAQCQVEGVPALRLFQDGEVLQSSEGAMNQQKLERFLDPYLPSTV